MSSKLAIVFDGPPSNESGRFIEIELDGAGVSFGEWQQNGDYWELVLPDPYSENVRLRKALEILADESNYVSSDRSGPDWSGPDVSAWRVAKAALAAEEQA